VNLPAEKNIFAGALTSTKNLFMSRLLLSFLLMSLLLGGCSKGKSQLADALAKAVKEKRISEKKVETIIEEYNTIKDEDKVKANAYVKMILSAIDMGGDSTHIDAVRRLAKKSAGKKELGK
jgi:nicotinamide riboside kinase